MARKQRYPERSARFSNGLASRIIRGLCHFCGRDFDSAGKEYAKCKGAHPQNWVFLMLCFLWTATWAATARRAPNNPCGNAMKSGAENGPDETKSSVMYTAPRIPMSGRKDL